MGFWLRVPDLEGGFPISGQADRIHHRLQQAFLARQYRPPWSPRQGEPPASALHLLSPERCSPPACPSLRDPYPKAFQGQVCGLGVMLLHLCNFLRYPTPTSPKPRVLLPNLLENLVASFLSRQETWAQALTGTKLMCWQGAPCLGNLCRKKKQA